jgi:hypothetical protein
MKEIRLVSTQKGLTTDQWDSKEIFFNSATEQTVPGQTTHELLRIVRAAQPIPRVAVARRLGVHRRRITVLVRPLIDSGILSEGEPERSLGRGVGRPPIGLSLRGDQDFLIGVNIGVSQTHIGAATVNGNLLTEERFPTSQTPRLPSRRSVCHSSYFRNYRIVAWRESASASLVRLTRSEANSSTLHTSAGKTFPSRNFWNLNVPVLVENNATAAAIYESQRRRRH